MESIPVALGPARTLLEHPGLDQVTDILKCKWSFAILEAISRGVNRPGRLERELPGLTTKVLNDRIRKLERYGVIVRHAYPEIPPRVVYELTDRGRRLVGLVKVIVDFADEWTQGLLDQRRS